MGITILIVTSLAMHGLWILGIHRQCRRVREWVLGWLSCSHPGPAAPLRFSRFCVRWLRALEVAQGAPVACPKMTEEAPEKAPSRPTDAPRHPIYPW